MLGGRYRIIAPIGRGASAQVFLADDVRLRRRVALKVLHAALADDADFLRRFQAEAQAAAALNHPNVMAVYDWGQDGGDDIPYLVLEYLGGGSLRAMLDRDERLSPSQALLIGLEATRGLEYAHRRGLVHRDIKPANLLFGDDARLRIADFGLARALAEAAWTEPQGAVLGTARYASPEQAQGQALTGKADVYSLALTLVEAVTGVVPFAADTTIGTLMARVGRDLGVPDALGPLQSPLQRAGRADPEDRLDAHDLGVALMATADRLPAPAPLPLADAVAAGIVADDPDPTLMTRLRQRDDDDLDELDVPDFLAAGALPAVPTLADGAVVDLTGDDATVTVADPPPPPVVSSDGEHRTRRRWPWVLLGLVLLAALGAGAAAFVARATRTPVHAVPQRVVGLSEDAARQRLARFKWDVREEHTRRDGTEPGEVIAVRPRPGVELEEGSRVTLVISDGNTPTAVPTDLRGKSLADAFRAIDARGLVARVGSRAFDEEIPKDHVIRLGDGTPTTMIKGQTIYLVVSDGPAPREVPAALEGATVEAAEAELGRVQLRAAISYRHHDEVAEGLVIDADQSAGTKLPRGSTVNLVVSLGPAPVAVPDVRGTTSIAEAAARLEAQGLVAGEVRGPAKGLPVATDPAAGTEVRRGTVVDLVLAG